jgi:hypothetical protein
MTEWDEVGAGEQHQGFPAAVEAFHDLCTGRHNNFSEPT